MPSPRTVAIAFGTAALTASAVTLGLWSRYVHPMRPRVNHQLIPLPRAHPELDGLTIAFVTDTHIGPHFEADHLRPMIDIVERAQPDIVLFGGDYVCESPRFYDAVQEPIARMARAGRLGAWAILGNHDLANLRARAEAMLAPTGATLLTNESVTIDTGKGQMCLVGLDDPLLGRSDFATGYANVPADAASILLWHVPDRAEEAIPYGSFLMLSGHTHGGQVRLPVVGPIALPKLGKRYVSGRYDLGSMTLLVSNGIGMYRPPVRFNCSPEVMIITLVAS